MNPYNQDAIDILSALLADCGYEAFESKNNCFNAYIQQNVYSQSSVELAVSTIKEMMGGSLFFTNTNLENINWNESWEREFFCPVYIGEKLVVHSSTDTDVRKCVHDIVINPRMAFGTGTHPTTYMLLNWLMENCLIGKKIIDAGCGTGVLGILAMKCGADSVFAYDIDEWSVENAQMNFQINNFSATVSLGNRDILKNFGIADLLIANINRNILLDDIPVFAKHIVNKGRLLISGFYKSDEALLVQCADKHNLFLKNKIYSTGEFYSDGMLESSCQKNNPWTLLEFEKSNSKRVC